MHLKKKRMILLQADVLRALNPQRMVEGDVPLEAACVELIAQHRRVQDLSKNASFSLTWESLNHL